MLLLAFQLLMAVTAVVTALMLVDLWFGMRRMPRLHDTPTDLDDWPRVSVVVPARDEAETIEKGLASLLSLDYPHLEIVAVNDRSADGTGAILDRLASEQPRLKVLSIDHLPEGWLGKNHACWRAAQKATGEWLLFTDADVVFQPQALKQAVALAVKGDWDHVVALPRTLHHTYLENAYVAYFSLLLMLRDRSFRPSRKRVSEFGVGAFNLVRRSVYDSFGGHSAIPLAVDDDMKLGYRMSKAGGSRVVALGIRSLELVWQVGLGGLVRGLEKNSFAVLNFSWFLLVWFTGVLGSWAVLPYLALLFPDDLVRALGAASIALQWAMYQALGEHEEYDPKVCFMHPLSTLLFLFTLWRSAVLTQVRGGVRWRDTFYPTSLLRGRQRGHEKT